MKHTLCYTCLKWVWVVHACGPTALEFTNWGAERVIMKCSIRRSPTRSRPPIAHRRMTLPTLLLQLTALRAPIDRRAVLSTAAAATASFASAPAQGSVGARVEELKALEKRAERSGAAPTAAEFWPGRLQGKPPPEPKVRLKDVAPPIVIFPGFGNDQIFNPDVEFNGKDHVAF